jgi:CO/xanthine dehydrogenase FAD-binding subunit
MPEGAARVTEIAAGFRFQPILLHFRPRSVSASRRNLDERPQPDDGTAVVKSAPFDYVRPRSVEEACALIGEGDDVTIIAGGQTLVPMMAMRLARPARLVDIARIPELAFIRDEGEAVVIGATTRQVEAERSALVKTKLPLLAKALPWVGHAATRNRGTLGGSIANADPAAEIPLVLVTLGGTIGVRGADGTLELAAEGFFVGPMMTTLPAGSCITQVRFPAWSGRVGAGFAELAARKSDFALAAAAAQIVVDAEGRCTACCIGINGATPAPIRLQRSAQALIGTRLTDADIRQALHGATDRLEIMTDPYGSPDFRRRAATTLALRALVEARDDALGRTGAAT